MKNELQMIETVKQIHNEFDTSIIFLLKKATDNSERLLKENQSMMTHSQKAIELEKLGFTNTIYKQLAEKTKNTNKEISINTGLQKTIEFYNTFYPLQRLILYPQVISILEKYNLYIGESNIYTGDIPDKNLSDIKNFDSTRKKLSNDNIAHLRNGGHVQALCAKKSTVIDEHTFNQTILNRKIYNLTEPYRLNPFRGNSYGSNSFYICAPIKDFKLDKTIVVGNEIVQTSKDFKPKLHSVKRVEVVDPIVLYPVNIPFFEELIGFLVVTAWGPEAGDLHIANHQINN